MSKERPILFSGPMVRAILDGRKTQTRRIVKLPKTSQPDPLLHHIDAFGNAVFTDGSVVRGFAEVGTRLWVQETHYVERAGGPGGDGRFVLYKATDKDAPVGRWTPSIHMFRWASRITLEVTGVRVERLESLSESDAVCEGVANVQDFIHLWTKINGSWEPKTWVWVVQFRRV